jgi:hypothetical protein
VTAGLATAAQQSQPVTDWPARLALTALVVLAVVALARLMLHGWRRRAGRQSDLPPLPSPPAHPGPSLIAPVEGTYVSSTSAGDWLDRIASRDLGVPSDATVEVTDAGVTFQRRGAADLFVPAAQLRGARREQGMVGKVVERDGLVVLTWELGDRLLDTGFRPRHAATAEPLVAVVQALVTEGSVS